MTFLKIEILSIKTTTSKLNFETIVCRQRDNVSLLELLKNFFNPKKCLYKKTLNKNHNYYVV